MIKNLAKEERQALAKLDVLNVFVNFESGENCLVYVSQPNISCETVGRFAEKVTGHKVLEAYHIPQKDLQYYCIGERIWCDTPAKAEKLRQIANS